MKQSLEWVKKELTAKDKWWIKSPEASKFFLCQYSLLQLRSHPVPPSFLALSELRFWFREKVAQCSGRREQHHVTALALICLPKISVTAEDLRS
jgi:hypothetical protein